MVDAYDIDFIKIVIRIFATGERVIIVMGAINILNQGFQELLLKTIHALLRVIRYNRCKQCMRNRDSVL